MLSNEKKKRRESQILRAMSAPIREVLQENPKLTRFILTRVELSREGGMCSLCFSLNDSVANASDSVYVKHALRELKDYVPAFRNLLAKTIDGRYTPHIRCCYDKQLEKVSEIESIFAKIAKE